MMMQDSKTPFFCSQFSWARERISPKIIDNLGTPSQKVCSTGVGYFSTYLTIFSPYLATYPKQSFITIRFNIMVVVVT
jgi:hypothetical protein